MTKAKVWFLLGLTTLLAAGLRFYHLDRLPPGLWFDEAWVSLQARDVVANGVYPLYFAADFGGIHPLVVYLTVVARWLTHNDPLAIRYAIAAAGVLTIPLTFLSLRAIFALEDGGDWGIRRFLPTSIPKSPNPRDSSDVALIGALVLAITFPYLLLNRVGFEVTLPAVFSPLIFGPLALAWREGGRRHYLLAGLALGASLYAYYAARLLPVAVIGVVLWLAAAGRRRWRWSGLALMAGAAGLVALPLALFFASQPDLFGARAGAVSYNTLGAGARSVPLAVATNALRTLAGFSLPGFGDALARHNLPGRPLFDPFLSVLFWLGVVTLLVRWRRPSSALLGAWAGVMLLPVILTDNAPTFTRLLGAMPALAGICAIGGMTLIRLVAGGRWQVAGGKWPVAGSRWQVVGGRRSRFTFHASRNTFHVSRFILLTGFLYSLTMTTYDYFGRWASDPRLFDAFQVGERQAAQLALAEVDTSVVYVAPDLLTPARPTFDLLLRQTPVKSLSGPDCLAGFDQPTQPLLYVVNALQDEGTVNRLAALYPAGRRGAPILHQPEPFTLFETFEVPAGAQLALPTPFTPATFGEEMALVGYTSSPAAPRLGDTLTIELYWQALSPPTADYTVFLHLYAAGQEERSPVAQDDAPPCRGHYPTSSWAAGEIVVESRRLAVPADLGADGAVLAVGVYQWPSLTRLPVNGAAVLPGDRLLLDEIGLVGDW